jgi:hypothetical protein
MESIGLFFVWHQGAEDTGQKRKVDDPWQRTYIEQYQSPLPGALVLPQRPASSPYSR